MNEFISGKALTSAIQELMAEDGVRCAVAFWGHGAQDWLKAKDATIICNLKMGGTNPHELRKIKGTKITQHDSLHAKVYIGSKYTVVTSANVSANGFGLEGNETSGWQEAGILTKTTDNINSWFATILLQSRGISDADWLAAEAAWHLRQCYRPTRPSFGEFNVYSENLPWIAWTSGGDWEQNEASITEHFGRYDSHIENLIDSGQEIEVEEDYDVIKNKWILQWARRASDGLPRQRSENWWVKLGEHRVPAAGKHVGETRWKDVVLGVEQMPPEPFDTNETMFKKALRASLGKKEFLDMIIDEYNGGWYCNRVDINQLLWIDIKKEYDALKYKSK